MAGSRIPGPTGLNVPQATIDPFTLQPISPRGVLGQNDGFDFNQALESEKKEIILDIMQLVLDITGILDPTPISDGSNALLSLARARWTDALISAVSIIPYIGDLAKLGKLPRYLSSIRKAIRIAKTDPKWAMALRRLFIKLKKLIDRLVEISANKLPDDADKILKQIKHEIDEFLSFAARGSKETGEMASKQVREVAEQQVRNAKPNKVRQTEKASESDIMSAGGKNVKLTFPVETKPDEAFFWSGRTGSVGGEKIAREIAQENKGTTLEAIIEKRNIEMPKWDTTNPDVVKAWKGISADYAKGSSGTVRAVIGKDLRPGNVWEASELPALKNNPNVERIITIDPVTKIETEIFVKGVK